MVGNQSQNETLPTTLHDHPRQRIAILSGMEGLFAPKPFLEGLGQAIFWSACIPEVLGQPFLGPSGYKAHTPSPGQDNQSLIQFVYRLPDQRQFLLNLHYFLSLPLGLG